MRVICVTECTHSGVILNDTSNNAMRIVSTVAIAESIITKCQQDSSKQESGELFFF